MKDGGCRARVAIQDLKTFGATDDWTHCPTSSEVSDRVVEYKACANGCAMIRAGAISAFTHSTLQADPVYVAE
eukprot:2464160-Alexandrium_andersonii.AAC.1